MNHANSVVRFAKVCFLLLRHHKIEDGGSVNLSHPGIRRVYGLERGKFVLRNKWTAHIQTVNLVVTSTIEEDSKSW